MDAEKVVRDGGGKVHRAAVHADGECRAAQKPDEFGQCGFVKKIDGVGWDFEIGVAASGEDDGNFDFAAKSGDGFRRQ